MVMAERRIAVSFMLTGDLRDVICNWLYVEVAIENLKK
jgi:hypothetical protein